MLQYILDADGEPQPCDDLRTWGEFMQTGDRIVAQETIGETKVSTVFLGIDHQFGQGPPVLWETMVFGGPLDGECDRYTTKAGAHDGHLAMVASVRAALARIQDPPD